MWSHTVHLLYEALRCSLMVPNHDLYEVYNLYLNRYIFTSSIFFSFRKTYKKNGNFRETNKTIGNQNEVQEIL